MDVADFDYELPAAAIAQQPIEPRHAARLLVDRGPGREPAHRQVHDLPGLVRPGDVLVVNDTRVQPARLHLRKATGGAVEVLLLTRVGPGRWEALVRPSRRVPAGTVVSASGLEVVVGDDLGEGRRLVTVVPAPGVDEQAAIAAAGELPLPPYIHEKLADPERYQTVFNERDPRWAGRTGDPAVDVLRSAAAPTAGLHLTDDVLDGCRAAGADVCTVRLAVGLGTFRPIATESVEDHHMHAERYSVPAEVLAACDQAQRVVAVGTTVVRALESAALGETEGATGLFIHRAFPFRVVDVLLTNFHVPRSSLLVLVDAFVGPRWRHLYAAARADSYRFLSFGDAMLLQRTEHGAGAG